MSVAAADAEFVRQLVRSEAAIVLDAGKDYLIEARLEPLAREAGLRDITELVARLRAGHRDLRTTVVEAMTTNETSFFRDIRPFDALRSSMMPELARRRQHERSLRAWSAAASTGQEAYSIAMTMRDVDIFVPNWDLEVFATDIADSVLAQARSGTYSQMEINRGLPARHLRRWFTQEGTLWRVTPDLQRMVQFRRLNLVSPWAQSIGMFDVVFLRNVLIYFDVETKRSILDQVKRVLRPDGYLVLGAAETMNGIHPGFRLERDERSSWYRHA